MNLKKCNTISTTKVENHEISPKCAEARQRHLAAGGCLHVRFSAGSPPTGQGKMSWKCRARPTCRVTLHLALMSTYLTVFKFFSWEALQVSPSVIRGENGAGKHLVQAYLDLIGFKTICVTCCVSHLTITPTATATDPPDIATYRLNRPRGRFSEKRAPCGETRRGRPR